ncbi:aminoglycoside phosphotransferase [Micromonospora sp. NPDC000018]|uniref:aminoglycoside phosphotransferase n=1 Tax=Micromonospora sp. NPDC000018 TaxID=3154239 RepID=UPI0033218737
MSASGLDEDIVDQLRCDLLVGARRVPIGRQVVQAWELSSVERLFLSDDSSLVCKIAAAPFTGEAAVLRALNEREAPVPLLHGYALRHKALGMLMEDLGDPLRPPTVPEAAAAACWVHAIPSLIGLPTFDQVMLAQLPERALDALAVLHQQARFLDGGRITLLLQSLSAVAQNRADGAERPPFGLCHGEFHPTSLHVSNIRCHLVDWAKAFTGPGLLDLATWFGTAAEPARLSQLIHAYIRTGGHPDAGADRGGLPAARWALGWHRMWAAWWFLTTAAAGHHRPATDRHHTQVVLRQLLGAAQLLNATPAGTVRDRFATRPRA